jgi:hypothetical protein
MPIIHSDHKPLMSLFSESICIPPNASARTQRWDITLSAYLQSREGQCKHRCAQPSFLMEKLSNSPVNVKQIKQWTDRDPILSQVKRFLMQGWPSVIEDDGLRPYAKRKTKLSVQDGCKLWGPEWSSRPLAIHNSLTRFMRLTWVPLG